MSARIQCVILFNWNVVCYSFWLAGVVGCVSDIETLHAQALTVLEACGYDRGVS
jgi:hypothetical protein